MWVVFIWEKRTKRSVTATIIDMHVNVNECEARISRRMSRKMTNGCMTGMQNLQDDHMNLALQNESKQINFRSSSLLFVISAMHRHRKLPAMSFTALSFIRPLWELMALIQWVKGKRFNGRLDLDTSVPQFVTQKHGSHFSSKQDRNLWWCIFSLQFLDPDSVSVNMPVG